MCVDEEGETDRWVTRKGELLGEATRTEDNRGLFGVVDPRERERERNEEEGLRDLRPLEKLSPPPPPREFAEEQICELHLIFLCSDVLFSEKKIGRAHV